jgi:DNA-binding CsgD family transcriptional regulator
MICHTVLALVFISLGYEWLLKVRTSLVSEKNRTEEKIESYIFKNKQLQDELDQLKVQISNERSVASLSERELEVLKHIDYSYTDIADKLFISRDTVITHKKNIEAKLKISGKKALEDFAIKKGIITAK